VFGVVFLLFSFVLDSLVADIVSSVQNPALDYLMSWVSYVISLVFVLLFMTSLFMWEENKKDWIIPLWFSSLSAAVISYILKFIVQRGRPGEVMHIFGLVDYSFPSAHAAISFAAIPILDEEYPALKWFWVMFACLIAVSRVYVGAHYLSDVIAGILIGYGIGLAVVYLKRKYSVFG